VLIVNCGAMKFSLDTGMLFLTGGGMYYSVQIGVLSYVNCDRWWDVIFFRDWRFAGC